MKVPKSALLLSSIAACLLAGAIAKAAPEGPPYYDPKRGIERQQEAARAARDEVLKGPVTKAFEHMLSVSAYVRDEVFETIVKDYSEEQLLELALGLGAREPFIAGTVAEILGRRKLKAAVPELEKALQRQRDEFVVGEICWALGQIGEAASAEVLEKTAERHDRSSYRIAGEAYQALARCAPKHAVRHLKEGLEARLAGVRIACLAELLRIAPKEGLEAALAQLGEKQERDWEDRVHIQCLENFRFVEKRKPHTELYKTIIDRLIPLLGEERGRVRHEIGRTLRSVTGEWDMGDDPLAWRDWWKVKRDGFVPVDLDRKRSDHGSGAGGDTVARYFGIPVYSKRVTFILDLSGGMDRPIGGKGTKTPQRLEVAKTELSKTLESLADDVDVNVIFFATKYFPFAPKLVPARKALRPLLVYIQKQEIPDKAHMNRGNLFGPILLAAQQEEVDTIYLVTEGNPTEGRFVDRDRFVRHMMRTLKYTKTEVNSLFIGSADSAKRYLEAISEPTGGFFIDVAERGGY